ncbi:oxidoreductase [Streptomyces sp. NPDC046876]|uniref:oxidoreductase n=1 Tax=Streptomyces sp. NPDC046876 TaxID=3155616 RepID=UPI003405293E
MHSAAEGGAQVAGWGEDPPEDLTTAELGLWQSFRNGSAYDLRAGDPAADDPGTDGRPWGEERALRARVIARLLLNGPPALPGRAPALKVRGAFVTGRLDLSNSQVTMPLELRDCRLEQPVELVDCTAGSIILDGSHIPRVNAARLAVQGDLSLRGCTVPSGIALPQARIGMDLVLAGLRLGHSRPGQALDGDGLNVGQDLEADGLHATGELTLRAARVGGTVSLRGCMLHHPAGTALNAARLVVEESLVLAPYAYAIDPEGGPRMRRASVRGNFRLDGASFGTSLVLDRLRVDLAPDQELSLRNVQTPELRFMPARPEGGRVDLGNAVVGRLVDTSHSWPGPGGLRMRNFTYEDLAPAGPFPLAQRLQWLADATPEYAPEPYERLAAVLRTAGEDADANEVLLAQARRRRDTLPPALRMWDYFQDLALGYGYRPGRGMVWLMVLWACGSVWFGTHRPPPLNAEEAPTWSAPIYTLDLLLPFLDLGQETAWRTSGASQWIALLLVVLGWMLATIVTAGAAALIFRRN